MLIRCNECSKFISDKAATCPSCGAPVSQMPKPGVQTIEATSKSYKGGMLTGGIIMAIGLTVALLGGVSGGGVIFVLGLLVYFWARMGAWWNNG